MTTQLSEKERHLQAFETILPIFQEASVTPKPSFEVTAFQEVIPQVQESLDNDPRLQFENDGKLRTRASHQLRSGGHSVNSEGRGQATYTRNAFMIKPSVSDFVADVTLAARRVLNREEFHWFDNVYLKDLITIYSREEVGEAKVTTFAEFLEQRYADYERSIVADFDLYVREKLGAELIRVGIFPINSYFQVKDARISKEFQYV